MRIDSIYAAAPVHQAEQFVAEARRDEVKGLVTSCAEAYPGYTLGIVTQVFQVLAPAIMCMMCLQKFIPIWLQSTKTLVPACSSY